MPSWKVGRIILAIIAGDSADAILTAVTEELLPWLTSRTGMMSPLYYFLIDVTTQCLYTVIGGYLCCVVAGPSRRTACLL